MNINVEEPKIRPMESKFSIDNTDLKTIDTTIIIKQLEHNLHKRLTADDPFEVLK